MLEKYKCLNPQTKNISELKSALLKIWDELPQDAVKSITSFHKCRSGRLVAENQHAGCCPPSDIAPGTVVPPDPLFHFYHWPCQISSKSVTVNPLQRYGDFKIFKDGSRPPSWIYLGHIWTTCEVWWIKVNIYRVAQLKWGQLTFLLVTLFW